MSNPDARPKPGWSEPDSRGHITFTQHDATPGDRAPERDGFECYWIGRHGREFTRWVYRPTKREGE